MFDLIFSFKPGKSAANILPAARVGWQEDYGIMAAFVPHCATLRDLFRFLLATRPALPIAFFFPVFLLKKSQQKRHDPKEKSEQNLFTKN
ncbi:hypothetical protein [Mucilaginibacter lacusdianchii]|uniref:hypothetical protein n=1 Tax=Mucilaginibacter lacusdianchii TaxID=2684211 RepID=UPI00131AB5F2|nr:hypothetical protein [Mucilaginibacter sp. JXJ CY 39]